MIAYLSGNVLRRAGNLLVVDVQGVGYGVHVSTYTFGKTIGADEIALHIYTHVREQEITLYGFQSPDEQELFEALITISGVGPKAAMNILSIADPQTILTAIAQGDAPLLTKVSGIGKKTAERIVLELGNKVQGLIDALPQKTDGGAQPHADADAIDALVSLGYAVAEARDALASEAASAIAGTDDAAVRARITAALKYLGKRK